MERVRLYGVLCGCSLAVSVSAAEVQIFRAKDVPPKLAVAATVTASAVAEPPSMASFPAPAAKFPAKEPKAATTVGTTPATAARGLPVSASASPSPASGQPAKKQFTYTDRKGEKISAPVIDQYREQRIVTPIAKAETGLNPKLVRAATIAQERARARSKSKCWRYVKNALLASGIISSYPKTVYAKQAGAELVRDYGFRKLPIRDPYKAPVGAVLVYGSRRAAGHVEIRTKTGFVSDFKNKKPSRRPLIGVYAKA